MQETRYGDHVWINSDSDSDDDSMEGLDPRILGFL